MGRLCFCFVVNRLSHGRHRLSRLNTASSPSNQPTYDCTNERYGRHQGHRKQQFTNGAKTIDRYLYDSKWLDGVSIPGNVSLKEAEKHKKHHTHGRWLVLTPELQKLGLQPIFARLFWANYDLRSRSFFRG